MTKQTNKSSLKKINVLAIIPARGGSKRIPNKNIINLCGKPLIKYTIDAAKKSKYINKIVVSTDDKKIKKVSNSLKVEVIERPKELSGDKTPMTPVLNHVVEYLEQKENYKADIVVLLQPTSPLRNSNDIDNTIKVLLNKKDVESAQTYCKITQHPGLMARLDKNNKPTPLNKKDSLKRTQDMPKFYIKNGAVFVVRYNVLKNKKTLYGKNHEAFIMPVERSIDIDEEIDLEIAKVLIKKSKKLK